MPLTNWFDTETTFPDLSSTNIEPDLVINVGQFSVSPQTLAVGINDDNITGSIPKLLETS